MTKIAGFFLRSVSAALLILGVIALTALFGIPTGWQPFSFAAYLTVMGYVLALAAITEILFKRGAWARWWFAFFFAMAAYQILSAERLPAEFPTSSGGLFGLAIYTTLLTLGAAHLSYGVEERKRA